MHSEQRCKTGTSNAAKGSEETIISASYDLRHYWRDAWQFRELLWMLAWRDISVRYKQTVFGFGWALLRPFLTMVVLTLIFGRLANLPSHNVPYALMVFAAVLPWQFFASGFADAGNSLIGNAGLVAKVYFPRIIVPAAAVIACFVDFVIAGAIYGGLCVWYGYVPGWQLLVLPAFVILLVLFIFACGVWVAALNVSYRDFRYVIPFIVQLGMYVSPVGFSSSIVPEQWRLLYGLNPMVGIIEGFRWSLLSGDVPLDSRYVALSLAGTIILLLTAVRAFRKLERAFADVI
jgi:lipopolysaccharide transport system permease protein